MYFVKLQSWTKVLGHLHFFAENPPLFDFPLPPPPLNVVSVG